MDSFAQNGFDGRAAKTTLKYSLAIFIPALILLFVACLIFGPGLVKVGASSLFLVVTISKAGGLL